LGAVDGALVAVVTAVPDAMKGERLVVFHLPIDKAPQDVCRRLAARGLPNLYIPSPDSFAEIEEIPVLGSGKLDLRALATLARERFVEGKAP
jgi:acyl-[acyl-carrier-protein]-phospholipid O-acyltransferase/long-chain-fatty-acid--[acyl-carrier-protein] ligase